MKGLTIGIPAEYRVPGMAPEIEALWQKGVEWLKSAGAKIKEVSLPHTKYALPVLLYRGAGRGLLEPRPL